MFRRALLIAFSSALVFATTSVSIAGEPSKGRPFYQIVVTSPGTRSQGWNGTLFQGRGEPLPVQPGQAVRTNIGTFVLFAQKELHDPYGFIEKNMSMQITNEIMGRESFVYRLNVIAECSKSEEFRGEIERDGKIVPGSPAQTILTPMGTFEWRDNPYENGWYHKSWPHHMMLTDGWGCPH